MSDPRDLFLTLCGIDVADVAVPHRLLRLAAGESNPQVINQAAAHLLAQLRMVADRIPAPHLDWMTQQVTQARNFMLLHGGQRQSPPAPPPPVPPPVPAQPRHANQPPAADPPVIVRPTVPRRRSGWDAENLLGIGGILVMLLAAGIGAKFFHDQWWKGMNAPPPRSRPPLPSPLPGPPIKTGQGQASVAPEPGPESITDPRPSRHPGAADAHLKSAFANVRKGFFDEADHDAQKAFRAVPNLDEAEAMRLLVGYVRQYPEQADEALAALNENDFVNLGPKYGEAAFLSRDDDGSIRFLVQGRPKSFSARQLGSMSDVRFRVTERFLDNGKNPANDLIIGGYHFAKNLDGDGNVARGNAAIDAARERWRKAGMAGDEVIRKQAGLLLKLLEMELSD